MFRREQRGSRVIEKRKGFAAGHWAMLGLLGAGAVTIAIQQQTRRRPPRKTRLDAALEGANMTTDTPETALALCGSGWRRGANAAGIRR